MAGSTLDTIAADIAALRRDTAALASGLTALADGQAAAVELLKALLDATTAGDGGEEGLAAVLGEIARALETQASTLAAIRDAVAPAGTR